MDIKLKKYKYSVWFKLLAIVLCVAGMLTMAYGFLKAPYFEYALENTDFNKNINNDIFSNVFQKVAEVAFTYKNENYIKSGAALSAEQIIDRKEYIISQREAAIQQISDKYNQLIQQRNGTEMAVAESDSESSKKIFTYPEVATESGGRSTAVSPSVSSTKLVDSLIAEKNKEIQDILDEYGNLLKSIHDDCIRDQLAEYKNKVENLNNLSGVYYTVVENDEVQLSKINNPVTSIRDFYDGLSMSVEFTKDNVASFFPNYSDYNTVNIPKNSVIYLGISKGKYNEELADFNKKTSEGFAGIKICSTGLLVFLVGLIYIIYSAGRRDGKEGIHLISMDYAYLDITLLIAGGAIFLCTSTLYQFVYYIWHGKTHMNNNLIMLISAVIITIGTLIGILYVSMFSKRAKRHEVIKHTFLFKLCTWFTKEIKNIQSVFTSVFDRSPMVIRVVLVFVAYAFSILAGALIFFAAGPMAAFLGIVVILGVNAAAIYYLIKILKTFYDIKDGAERIRAGELTYNIPEQGILELRQLSATINKIGDGLKNAVGSRVKAERMKTELITNVSHDLKTPLTSIITYVDLLKNEGLHSENAEKYLDIIDSKSQRLKVLTEDLFEAAKATSGSITVNAERLDVVSLLSQGLGELSDKIEASGLIFKTSLPSEKLFVMADGKLLWRVIENLISNVLKYALPGSRVYIDISESSAHVTLNIKNISAYELNVDEEELMERFKRGDASRHSEGSGLGLSIAKSLTELQGGNFHIEIDGDLFKAVIVLPAC